MDTPQSRLRPPDQPAAGSEPSLAVSAPTQTLPHTAAPRPDPGPRFEIDPAAVSILVDTDNPQKPLGTGFYFLQPQYFVTAKHVVIDRYTGLPRRNLVIVQAGPDYPHAEVLFRHPTVDIAVLKIDRPVCKTPLYPSDQRFTGEAGLKWYGYAPTLSHANVGVYAVLVGGPADYKCEEPRERHDGIEWVIRFDDPHCQPGHSGGPVLGMGGGVVAVITEGGEGWFRATEIQSLLPYVAFQFPG